MDVNDYLTYRKKLIRRLNRSTDRENHYHSQEEEGILSKYGYQELGIWQGRVTAIEDIIDELDKLHGIPYQDELVDIEEVDKDGK